MCGTQAAPGRGWRRRETDAAVRRLRLDFS